MNHSYFSFDVYVISQNVLKTDPEAMLNSDSDPDPLVELEFWCSKARNLNSVQEQIKSERMQAILGFLAATEVYDVSGEL